MNPRVLIMQFQQWLIYDQSCFICILTTFSCDIILKQIPDIRFYLFQFVSEKNEKSFKNIIF